MYIYMTIHIYMLNTYPNGFANAIVASNDKTEMCSMEAVHSHIISLTVNYKTEGTYIVICVVLQCLCIYTKDGSRDGGL